MTTQDITTNRVGCSKARTARTGHRWFWLLFLDERRGLSDRTQIVLGLHQSFELAMAWRFVPKLNGSSRFWILQRRLFHNAIIERMPLGPYYFEPTCGHFQAMRGRRVEPGKLSPIR